MKRLAAAVTSAVCVLLLGAILIVAPSPLSAQSIPSPGDTVRVSTVAGEFERGIFEGVRGDRLLLRGEFGAHREIPRSDVQQLDVLVGTERRFLRNLSMTVGLLAAAGGLGYAAIWSPCTDTGFLACMFHPTDRFEAFGMGAFVGGAIGVPIGAVVGLQEYDVWEEGSLSASAASRASLKLGPAAGGGIGFSASVPLGGALRVR